MSKFNLYSPKSCLLIHDLCLERYKSSLKRIIEVAFVELMTWKLSCKLGSRLQAE